MDDLTEYLGLILLIALVIVVPIGCLFTTYTFAQYGACQQIAELQPELQPHWQFFNGCMVVNPYTGYLQALSDWSESQNYIKLDD